MCSYVWFLSLSVMFLKFICDVACIINFFLLTNILCCMDTLHFVYLFPTDKHLDYFQVWAIKSNGMIFTCQFLCGHVFISFG